MKDLLSPRDQLIAQLYRAFPGADMPPSDEEGFTLWGEVCDSPIWEFCAQVVDMMDRFATPLNMRARK
jgi:hypothetical protein